MESEIVFWKCAYLLWMNKKAGMPNSEIQIQCKKSLKHVHVVGPTSLKMIN